MRRPVLVAVDATALADCAARLGARVVSGSPSRDLLPVAHQEASGLRVVEVHSDLFGSTIHPIVRGANCPALSVLPGGAQEALKESA